MTFNVILLKQADDGYTARPVLWPEAMVHGATEQEALNRVRALIRELLNRTQFVQVEVEVPGEKVDNPWLPKAGMFVHDPTWDDFLKAMTDYRRQLAEDQNQS